jgi:mono/diheme cytochrome c family protein
MRWMSFALLVGTAAVVQAQGPSPPQQARGEILYRTHCIGCHTTQVHWREKTLVSDWTSLAAQVGRWEKNANLGWSGEDVDAVARYLNAAFYHLPPPAGKAIGEGPPAYRIAVRN